MFPFRDSLPALKGLYFQNIAVLGQFCAEGFTWLLTWDPITDRRLSWSTYLFRTNEINWPLALRGHVTNAFFKQWVGILLMPKLLEHTKIILHPKFERKRIKGRYFVALWFLSKVVWLVLAAMLEGMLLPSNMASKTTSCLYLVQPFIVTLKCAANVIT